MKTGRKTATLGALPLALCLCLLAGCASVKPPNDRPAPRASYVFRGKVTGQQTTTLEQFPATPQTYAVKVDEIYFQKGSFNDLTGSRITVVDPEADLMQGKEYLFYTEPLMFGGSIAVTLLEARKHGKLSDEEAEEVKEEDARQEIGERVRQAEAIVFGSVVSVRPWQPSDRTLRSRTEHEPGLHLALVKVQEVLKGDVSGDEVSFLFSASTDVQWYRAPKLDDGDEGIFLLNTGTEAEAAMGVDAGRLTLFHPLDFQPTDRLETIRELLQ